MKAPDGTFIQFACGVNQTVNNDLFFKHLLKNIAEKNVNVTEMFRRIADDVYQESNRKQQPWCLNRLSRHEHIYLNERKLDKSHIKLSTLSSNECIENLEINYEKSKLS
jgi:collagenase-like PrtC family protease